MDSTQIETEGLKSHLPEGVNLLIASWNVYGKAPGSDICLKEWICRSEIPLDIVVVGFQELEWTELIPNEDGGTAEKVTPVGPTDTWRNLIQAALRNQYKDTNYEELLDIKLEGKLLFVYVKTELRKFIKNEASAVCQAGKSPTGGNGAVGVSFELDGVPICFVSCHLYPHTAEVARRNDNYHQIRDTMTFGPGGKLIHDHEHIFIFGDLNYRLNPDTIEPTVSKKDMIADGQFAQLLDHDQLKEQIRTGRAFELFEEGPIAFQPTYKYDPGTDQWDSSDKKRAPAWCDRILYKSQSSKDSSRMRVRQVDYVSHHQYRLSDHKPISSVYYKFT